MWDSIKSKEIEMPENIKNFLIEIKAICEKYNLSISHEDYQGAFIIEDYNENNIEWLQSAHLNKN